MRFHINEKTGRVNICRAQKKVCPLTNENGTPAPHFHTKEEAHEYNASCQNFAVTRQRDCCECLIGESVL